MSDNKFGKNGFAVGTITSIGAAAKETLKLLVKRKAEQLENTAITGSKNIVNGTLDGNYGSSIIEYSKVLRVEPFCLVEKTLEACPALIDIEQTLLLMYSGYYVQALAISNNVGSVNVRNRLEKFNPSLESFNSGEFIRNRDFNRLKAALEDYEENDFYSAIDKMIKSGLSDREIKDNLAKAPNITKEEIDKNLKYYYSTKEGLAASQQSTLKDTVRAINEKASLAVGKLLNIEIGDGEHSVVMPVGIQLSIGLLRRDSLKNILTFTTQDFSALDRKVSWKQGKLSFWKDLVFCRDLVNKYRKTIIQEKDGSFKSTISRRNNIIKNDFAKSMTTPAAAITSLMIITKSLADEICINSGKTMDDYSFRNDFMDHSGIMILVVVDEAHRMATFYYHSIKEGSDFSFNVMKSAKSSDGGTINEIVGAMLSGQIPRI